MPNRFYIKRYDRLPSIVAELRMPDGRPPSMSGVTVKFIYRLPNQPASAVSRTATIVDEACARVRYDWQSGDTSTAGRWQCEWEVTFADGRKLTFPNDGYDELVIVDDLNGV